MHDEELLRLIDRSKTLALEAEELRKRSEELKAKIKSVEEEAQAVLRRKREPENN